MRNCKSLLIPMLAFFFVLFLIPLNFVYATCTQDASKCSGLTKEECAKLNEFKGKICDVEAIKNSANITSVHVEGILGKPDFLADSVHIEDQGKAWGYHHPAYASVHFILVFDKKDNLKLMLSAQVLDPRMGLKYYDVDYYLK